MNTHCDTRTVVIVAGEASGDSHAGALADAMMRGNPNLRMIGVGGEAMAEAGVELVADIKSLNVMGLTEIVRKLKSILHVFLSLLKLLKEASPGLLVLVDFPDFNLLLARFAKRYNIPILYYISPQLWAWRAKRTKTIARLVDKMLVILPFEEDFYRNSGINAEFVGHPLIDALRDVPGKLEARKALGIKDKTPLIGLLPGSRPSEIRRLAPVMLEATKYIRKSNPESEFILPLARTIHRKEFPFLSDNKIEHLRIFEGQTAIVIKACDLIVGASGTVTLESAILGTPLVIVYKLSPFTYLLARQLIKVPYIGLVNLVARECLAPELIQHDVTPLRIAEEAFRILGDRNRQEYLQKRFVYVKKLLGNPGAADRAAKIALHLLRVR